MAEVTTETVLTCNKGHRFATRARPRQSVRCPTCKKGGVDTSVWVTTQSTKAGGAGSAQWAGAADALPELDYTAGDTCPACGDERVRSPRGDLVACCRCNTVGLPTATVENATRPAAGVRSGPSPDDAILLDADKQAMLERLHHWEWLDFLDTEEWAVNWGDREHVAWWHARLSGLAARMTAARDAGELGEWSSKYATAVREGLDGHPTLDKLTRNRGIGLGVAGQVASTLPAAEPLAITTRGDENDGDSGEYVDAEIVENGAGARQEMSAGAVKLQAAAMAVVLTGSFNPAVGVATGLALGAGALMSKRRAVRTAETGSCEYCGKPAVRRLLASVTVMEYGYGRLMQVLLCGHGLLGRGTGCEMTGRAALVSRGLTTGQFSMEAL